MSALAVGLAAIGGMYVGIGLCTIIAGGVLDDRQMHSVGVGELILGCLGVAGAALLRRSS